MDQTPRLRSAFPQTPRATRRTAEYGGSPAPRRSNQPIPEIPTIKPATSQPPSDPLIPEHILDAPAQRLFVVSCVVALWTWRIWDWSALNDLDEQSLWLFMKWAAIDLVFLFGLPALRIPWLEWSSSTMTLLFFMHAFVDGMLMFRIPVPVGAGLAAVGRSIWGAYELAVNEHAVNPDVVKFNDSLILGRQIIHILPEGSAILNPEKQSFCIDGTRLDAKIPIMINSTSPISMELLRTDLETQANETIHISKSQIKTMHKEASRLISYSDKPDEPKTLYYSVRKPGLYVLSKVVDESNLEVARKRLAHTVVVPCPRAAVMSSSSNRCRGEISNIEMEVVGTPPLTLKYQKVVNHAPQKATFENILPENFVSPLAKQDQSALVVPNKVDTSWARPQRVVVPLGESLDRPGHWVYSIEEVRDAFGNRVSYSSRNPSEQTRTSAKNQGLQQVINVHERPTVSLKGCTPQQPLKRAKGESAYLPVVYGSTGKGELSNTTYNLDFAYKQSADVSDTGEREGMVPQTTFKRKKAGEQPRINKPGLYTLTGISTDFCSGEVLEPASCVLQNPPEPKLNISKSEMFDKCAGRPIGLTVDMDLLGTPPFVVHYRVTNNKMYHDEYEKVNGLRGQMELTPREAGHYRYDFVAISDAVYRNQQLQGLSLEQNVKPSASARFIDGGARKVSCIDDMVSFDVALQGEGPFTIEYELIHGGRRKKYKLENPGTGRFQISTDPLTDGGDYTLALISITDKMGCKETLKDEVRISVRHQKPRVGFKNLDGRRSVSTLEGRRVQLPLRLEGDPPWTVKYFDIYGMQHSMRAQNANDRITVTQEGTYELFDVHDGTCPGTVDEAAKEFDVSWIPRPELRIPLTDIMERKDSTLIKADVCEGEDDVVEILFKGLAPYRAHYVQHIKPERGTMAPKNKEIKASTNVAALRMDTNQAGFYEYKFDQLADENYEHSVKHFTPISIQQRVHAKPSAAFASPGKKYSFCSVESDGEEVIPITLHGAPPFDLEVEIKHLGSAKPETVALTGIMSTSHNIRIPHSRLHLGRSAVHLRRVSDSRGCVRSLDSTTPHVQIAVHDAPTITALEAQSDFCVGDRINFALSGVPPFNVFYTFEGANRKAVASSTAFRRLAEKPGTFVITGLQDSASACKSTTNITKHIHGMPSVRVSKGKESYVDIHEGGFTDITFDFGGVPPFEFTYTRSSNTDKHGKKPGKILDMHSERSEGDSLRLRAHEEGTYEVISIKDRYCAYAKPGVKVDRKEAQKRLQY
ncbi:hypothetical protein LTR37_003613 [Vermiconidia calcicola]|uniref:Uncharacterized protein n=1 Tax=Vermiconidia calcicola TaxID=1690605 RepID=A0ACC3NRZ0_9PEZI|nr:hypothetical protein LTR37_003613 [Vermiconidia calcicola]